MCTKSQTLALHFGPGYAPRAAAAAGWLQPKQQAQPKNAQRMTPLKRRAMYGYMTGRLYTDPQHKAMAWLLLTEFKSNQAHQQQPADWAWPSRAVVQQHDSACEPPSGTHNGPGTGPTHKSQQLSRAQHMCTTMRCSPASTAHTSCWKLPHAPPCLATPEALTCWWDR